MSRSKKERTGKNRKEKGKWDELVFFGFRFNVTDLRGDLLQAILVVRVLLLQLYAYPKKHQSPISTAPYLGVWIRSR